jgi:hypothetical protein
MLLARGKIHHAQAQIHHAAAVFRIAAAIASGPLNERFHGLLLFQ